MRAYVVELDRAHAAGEKISWQGMNGLRFAARLAREDFLDFDKSFFFCDKLMELADSDYWRVPARLERAMTHRAMGDYEKANREYDAIASADDRQRAHALLPRAEMVYCDMADEPRGRELLKKALMNAEINSRERFNALRRCVQHMLTKGQRHAALAWYATLEQMPFSKPGDRDRLLCQAWYEMGRIEESLGQTAAAKALYRKAMTMEQGDMRYRTRARDALEDIEYFE